MSETDPSTRVKYIVHRHDGRLVQCTGAGNDYRPD